MPSHTFLKRDKTGRFLREKPKPPVIRTARSRSGQTQQAKAALRRLEKDGTLKMRLFTPKEWN